MQPLASDLSQDQRWRIHAFERDAVTYFQVSDSTGSIQFILGKSGDVFWQLPAGPADTQISLPSDDRQSITSAGAVAVYRDDEFKILANAQGSTIRWSIELVPAGD